MRNPLVSIVLPTYNGSRYIEASLESIRSQSFRDWELIVVDDASTDTTPTILQRYASSDPRITVVRNATNRKLPGSLNIGFAHARGEFHTWTSDDNLYRPQAIARMLSLFDTNVSLDLVYAGTTEIDENGEPLYYMRALPPQEIGRRCIVRSCFLYRRRVYEALGGYRETYHYSEDEDFWLRAYCQFTFRQIDEDLYCYRRQPNSMSSQKPIARAAITKTLEDILPALATADRRAAADAAMRLSRIYLNDGRMALGQQTMFKALRLNWKRALRERRVVSILLFGRRITDLLRINEPRRDWVSAAPPGLGGGTINQRDEHHS